MVDHLLLNKPIFFFVMFFFVSFYFVLKSSIDHRYRCKKKGFLFINDIFDYNKNELMLLFFGIILCFFSVFGLYCYHKYFDTYVFVTDSNGVRRIEVHRAEYDWRQDLR